MLDPIFRLVVAGCGGVRRARAIALLATMLAALAVGAPAKADTHEQMMESLGHSRWSYVQSAARPGTDAAPPRQASLKGRRPAAAAKLAAASQDEDAPKPRARGRKVASLGPGAFETTPKPAIASGGISWVASAGCLAGQLQSVIADIAANFGPVRVSSTCRSHAHNRRVGGARKSYHLSGEAADFRIFGNVGAVYAYLRGNGSVGGLKHYGGGLFHIDTGPRRPM